MPLFYLHLCNGSGFTEDRSGQDFPDLEVRIVGGAPLLAAGTVDEVAAAILAG